VRALGRGRRTLPGGPCSSQPCGSSTSHCRQKTRRASPATGRGRKRSSSTPLGRPRASTLECEQAATSASAPGGTISRRRRVPSGEAAVPMPGRAANRVAVGSRAHAGRRARCRAVARRSARWGTRAGRPRGRRQVVQVEEIGLAAPAGRAPRPRPHQPLVGGIVDHGEDAVGGGGPVLVGGLKRTAAASGSATRSAGE